MAKTKSKKSKGKSKKFVKVANLWKSKDYEGQRYISADTYFGTLYFVEAATGRQYKVEYLNCFKPKAYDDREPPKNLVYNITINLDKAEYVGGGKQKSKQSEGNEEE